MAAYSSQTFHFNILVKLFFEHPEMLLIFSRDHELWRPFRGREGEVQQIKKICILIIKYTGCKLTRKSKLKHLYLRVSLLLFEVPPCRIDFNHNFEKCYLLAPLLACKKVTPSQMLWWQSAENFPNKYSWDLLRTDAFVNCWMIGLYLDN